MLEINHEPTRAENNVEAGDEKIQPGHISIAECGGSGRGTEKREGGGAGADGVEGTLLSRIRHLQYGSEVPFAQHRHSNWTKPKTRLLEKDDVFHLYTDHSSRPLDVSLACGGDLVDRFSRQRPKTFRFVFSK